MIDIFAYRGPAQFGKAYRVMCENDTHTPGSVDRVLGENMIRLCSETAEYLYTAYTPEKSDYKKGIKSELEEYADKIISTCSSDEERIEKIILFTSSLQNRAASDLDSMRFGGTEDDIITRGSDWCTDVARVGCALCQVASFPARMVYLFDITKAYHGHVIIEVYRDSTWGAVDTVTNVIYRHEGGKAASAWKLLNSPEIIEKHWRGDSTYYTTPDQFSRAAISNYFVSESREYDYTVSRLNDYKRSVLEMAEKGWPGGFRWLHGENA
ncbi:MAG: transglutaminase domain-containing protein [Dehalococcoidales bacterium]